MRRGRREWSPLFSGRPLRTNGATAIIESRVFRYRIMEYTYDITVTSARARVKLPRSRGRTGSSKTVRTINAAAAHLGARRDTMRVFSFVFPRFTHGTLTPVALHTTCAVVAAVVVRTTPHRAFVVAVVVQRWWRPRCVDLTFARNARDVHIYVVAQ